MTSRMRSTFTHDEDKDDEDDEDNEEDNNIDDVDGKKFNKKEPPSC